jgi:hypothetical protein
VANLLKRVIGSADNFIDSDIDRIIKRMKSETKEQFKARWDTLSDDSKATVKRLLQEQIKVEVKHQRLDDLETLWARLETL